MKEYYGEIGMQKSEECTHNIQRYKFLTKKKPYFEFLTLHCDIRGKYNNVECLNFNDRKVHVHWWSHAPLLNEQ